MNYICTFESFDYNSETSLRDVARQYQDQFSSGEDGYADPNKLSWKYVKNYPIDKFIYGNTTKDSWVDWIKQEIEWAEEDGREGYYDDLFEGDIHTSIVVVELNGLTYIWDGNHRVGASIAQGKETIPAIVGYKKGDY